LAVAFGGPEPFSLLPRPTFKESHLEHGSLFFCRELGQPSQYQTCLVLDKAVDIDPDRINDYISFHMATDKYSIDAKTHF
jgi:hypothetical protein